MNVLFRDLTSNQIAYIDPKALTSSISSLQLGLVLLNLNNNKLQHFPAFTIKAPSLKTIDLSGNKDFATFTKDSFQFVR